VFKKIIEKLRSNLYSSAPVQQDIVGIDLAHDYIRTVQLTKNRNQWSLSKISCKSVNWLAQDKETKDQEILRLLKNCRLEQKFDTLNAAVSLPVSSAIIQVIQIPYLAEDELIAAVENGSLWENTINVPGDFNEYSIFWQVIKKIWRKISFQFFL
jgi:type IV pilus assembly protein PilN